MIVYIAVNDPSDDEDDDENGSAEDEEEESQDGECQGSEGKDDEKEKQIKADEQLAEALAEEELENTSATPGVSTSNGPSDPVPGTSQGTSQGSSQTENRKEDEEEDAEASSSEIAWEVLSLARVVFTKQVEQATGDKLKEYQLKLAEALQSLGEISIEWENFEAALDLLQDALSLRKECLPADDRLIAET